MSIFRIPTDNQVSKEQINIREYIDWAFWEQGSKSYHLAAEYGIRTLQMYSTAEAVSTVEHTHS